MGSKDTHLGLVFRTQEWDYSDQVLVTELHVGSCRVHLQSVEV